MLISDLLDMVVTSHIPTADGGGGVGLYWASTEQLLRYLSIVPTPTPQTKVWRSLWHRIEVSIPSSIRKKVCPPPPTSDRAPAWLQMTPMLFLTQSDADFDHYQHTLSGTPSMGVCCLRTGFILELIATTPYTTHRTLTGADGGGQEWVTGHSTETGVDKTGYRVPPVSSLEGRGGWYVDVHPSPPPPPARSSDDVANDEDSVMAGLRDVYCHSITPAGLPRVHSYGILCQLLRGGGGAGGRDGVSDGCCNGRGGAERPGDAWSVCVDRGKGLEKGEESPQSMCALLMPLLLQPSPEMSATDDLEIAPSQSGDEGTGGVLEGMTETPLIEDFFIGDNVVDEEGGVAGGEAAMFKQQHWHFDLQDMCASCLNPDYDASLLQAHSKDRCNTGALASPCVVTSSLLRQETSSRIYYLELGIMYLCMNHPMHLRSFVASVVVHTSGQCLRTPYDLLCLFRGSSGAARCCVKKECSRRRKMFQERPLYRTMIVLARCVHTIEHVLSQLPESPHHSNRVHVLQDTLLVILSMTRDIYGIVDKLCTWGRLADAVDICVELFSLYNSQTVRMSVGAKVPKIDPTVGDSPCPNGRESSVSCAGENSRLDEPVATAPAEESGGPVDDVNGVQDVCGDEDMSETTPSLASTAVVVEVLEDLISSIAEGTDGGEEVNLKHSFPARGDGHATGTMQRDNGDDDTERAQSDGDDRSLAGSGSNDGNMDEGGEGEDWGDTWQDASTSDSDESEASLCGGLGDEDSCETSEHGHKHYEQDENESMWREVDGEEECSCLRVDALRHKTDKASLWHLLASGYRSIFKRCFQTVLCEVELGHACRLVANRPSPFMGGVGFAGGVTDVEIGHYFEEARVQRQGSGADCGTRKSNGQGDACELTENHLKQCLDSLCYLEYVDSDQAVYSKDDSYTLSS